MERFPVTSKVIKSRGYDPERQILELEFHGKGDTPGKVYVYEGFTPEDWAKFQAANSVGTHFGQHIAGRFKFNKAEVVNGQGKPTGESSASKQE